jgi:c-di-GMP phosphodiesterase
MSQSATQSSVFMARQPIYDRKMGLHAYELLFRNTEGRIDGEVGDAESASALVNALMEIGLDQLVGSSRAFLNIPESLLLGEEIYLLPSQRTVIEVLETVSPTEEVIEAIGRLKRSGYEVALDDYIFGSNHDVLTQHCKIIKVDVMENDLDACRGKLMALKARGAMLLAEKVETPEMHKKCLDLGFDLFQGYFFAKPTLVAGKGIPQNRAILINLITRLQDPMVTMEEVEQLVANDVTLSYRLLKLVNSAGEAARKVESIRSALLLLGVDKVVSLVSLLMMSKMTDKPAELMLTAMIRARMCEQYANANGRKGASARYFTAGLLSVLDAMFDQPMEELLKQLPLAPEIVSALVDPEHDPEIGEALRAIYALERGEWNRLEQVCTDPAELSTNYVHAVHWAEENAQALAA